MSSNRFGIRLSEGLERRWQRVMVAIAGRMGRYDRYREVEWLRVKRLVFVCSGNICRSPFAQYLALDRGLQAISCGTTALAGSTADTVAMRVASRFGVDVSPHRSALLGEDLLVATDLVVAMDLDHFRTGRFTAGRVAAQVTLLGLWDGCQPLVIPDPYGRPEDEFERVFSRINTCLEAMLQDRAYYIQPLMTEV